MKKILDKRLADDAADQVRRSIADAIREIQDLPASSLRVIKNVQLPASTAVQVAHSLGRRPLAFWATPPRGAATAGVIQDFGTLTPNGAPNDTSQTLCLVALGFGATITVDIVVM